MCYDDAAMTMYLSTHTESGPRSGHHPWMRCHCTLTGLFIGDEMQKKACTTCGIIKPLSEYYKKPIARDGVTTSCKLCLCSRVKKRNEQLPPEYGVWRNMRRRCNNPRDEHYKWWGARGIKVCERWNSYSNFYDDMGSRPTPKHRLDRTNNDGNYEPSNCQWVTETQQQRNRRDTVLTMPKARLIRWYYGFGHIRVRDISIMFEVSDSVVHHVIRNETWKEDEQIAEAVHTTRGAE